MHSLRLRLVEGDEGRILSLTVLEKSTSIKAGEREEDEILEEVQARKGSRGIEEG